jgi:multiple antibiotic resistance protein
MLLELPVRLFLALFALFTPVASLSAYFPLVSRIPPADQVKLAVGVFTYVMLFGMFSLWVGEPILEVLGISTDALTVTGGIALLFAGIPILRGAERPVPKQAVPTDQTSGPVDWKSVVFMPVTFPLAVNGTTFALIVAARSEARGLQEVFALSAATIAYAALTGITLIVSSHLERRVSWGTRNFLDRIAGVLLVATASMLLLSGVPRMVAKTLGLRGGQQVQSSTEGEVK